MPVVSNPGKLHPTTDMKSHLGASEQAYMCEGTQERALRKNPNQVMGQILQQEIFPICLSKAKSCSLSHQHPFIDAFPRYDEQTEAKFSNIRGD